MAQGLLSFHPDDVELLDGRRRNIHVEIADPDDTKVVRVELDGNLWIGYRNEEIYDGTGTDEQNENRLLYEMKLVTKTEFGNLEHIALDVELPPV